MIRFYNALLLLTTLLTTFLASSVHAEWLSEQRDMMGTRITLTLWADDATVGEQAQAAAFAEVQRLNDMLSPYLPESELARVNREAAKGPMTITPELVKLLDKSLYYGQLTEGAFDITFASLGRYYDYRAGKKPTSEQQHDLLASINYRHVLLNRDQQTVAFARDGVQIDLGGIAKGYTADRVMAILQSFGITHASFSAGGDSRVLGDRRGRPWIVGIRNPRQQEGSAIVLPLVDVAISTSGDYERYFLDQATGERVHHILNPRTGSSASGIMSVTILGPQGFDTDPLSTSVFVLGVEKGLALINRLRGFDAVVIASDGKVHYSEGLAPPSP